LGSNKKRCLSGCPLKGVCLVICFFIGIAWAAQAQIPFHSKEKLIFHVKWSFIHAGEASLEILPTEIIKGVPSYHFVLTVRTSEFVDLFYKIRDRIDSYTDNQMTHSLLYLKQQQGKSKSNIIVDMDWEKGLAHYSNFGKKETPIPIRPGSFDPLSIFYAFRSWLLVDNLIIQTPVTDGKQCIMSHVKVIKRETIQVPVGSFDTFLVEPEMGSIDGVFKKSQSAKLYIWVTADTRQMPVRIKSGVKVGSFIAELVSYETGSP
jgi:hypothetical protein